MDRAAFLNMKLTAAGTALGHVQLDLNDANAAADPVLSFAPLDLIARAVRLSADVDRLRAAAEERQS